MKPWVPALQLLCAAFSLLTAFIGSAQARPLGLIAAALGVVAAVMSYRAVRLQK